MIDTMRGDVMSLAVCLLRTQPRREHSSEPRHPPSNIHYLGGRWPGWDVHPSLHSFCWLSHPLLILVSPANESLFEETKYK